MYYYRIIAYSLIAFFAHQSASKAADAIPLSVASESGAQQLNAPIHDGWKFSASPYFWAAGISGTAGQFGLPPVKLTADFGTVFKDLDFSFMGVMEGHYDRYSLFSDVIYTKTSTGGATPLGVLSDDVAVTSQMFTGFFGGGYSLLQEDKNRLDVVAGGRIWYASTKISFSGGLLNGHGGRDSATWIDAVAGVKGKAFLSDEVYLSGWAVAGGGQAKLDWDLAATIGYQFKNNISAVAGYRALGVDYSRDGFVYDIVQKGPILGLVVHF